MSAEFTHPHYERWRAQGGAELAPLPLSCDVCGERSFTTIRETVDGGRMPVVACNRCGCLLQSIRLPAEFYDWYYAHEYRKRLFGESAVPQAFIDDQRARGAALLQSDDHLIQIGSRLLVENCIFAPQFAGKFFSG